MIISHKNKFVFAKSTKTGSTSAQAAIINSGILGESDIYSGYRHRFDSISTEFKNMPNIYNRDVIKISPHNIPELITSLDDRLPLVGAMTPTEMYRLKLIDDTHVSDYTFVTILRDPIRRYISAWFYGRTVTKMPTTANKLIESINLGFLPGACLGKFGVSSYCECEGKKLKMHYFTTENLTEDVTKFLKKYNAGSIDIKRFKSEYTPDWAKVDYNEWMPKHCIDALKKQYANEIADYEERMNDYIAQT